MKHIVMLCDGLADWPIESLGGRTPVEAAHTPNMDELARRGAAGMVRTIPAGMPPGSDAANMSVMGYAPAIYYSGRSPLEAVGMGIELKPTDVAIRCNLSTLSDEPVYEDKTLLDFSADEISTDEAAQLIQCLREHLDGDMRLYTGISFRHCLVLADASTGTQFTAPHDIMGKPIREYLPKGLNGERLAQFQRRSWELLRDHPVNRARAARGKPPANTCWLWGEGRRPSLKPFKELFGLEAGMVCAVDLLKGLAACTGMKAPHIPGATGAKRTDCAAKARAALRLLEEGCELVYIHVEAPDESAHAGDLACKIEAIEAIDREILGPVMRELRERNEAFRILLLPDHPTPLAIRTHIADPVPFVLWRSDRDTPPHAEAYSEAACARTGLFVPEGPMLMRRLISGDFC